MREEVKQVDWDVDLIGSMRTVCIRARRLQWLGHILRATTQRRQTPTPVNQTRATEVTETFSRMRLLPHHHIVGRAKKVGDRQRQVEVTCHSSAIESPSGGKKRGVRS